MSERVCYRYRTAALCGPWRRLPEAAHRDAVGAGQIRPNDEEVTWLVQGEIEASYCDKGGPCGGQFPPEDGPDGSTRASERPSGGIPPPLDGEGWRWSGVSGEARPFINDHPRPISPVEGEAPWRDAGAAGPQ